MKQRVEEMEREAKKLRELQAAAESANGGSATEADQGVPMETEEDKSIADGRSVFVGNVRLSAPSTMVMNWLILFFLSRWTMAQPQKKYKRTSRLAGRSIV
jgi:hypothetical protein